MPNSSDWFDPKLWSDLIEDFKEAGSEALKNGVRYLETTTTLFEEAEIRNYKDYEEILHKDIPDLLKEASKHAGYTCTVYHLKDDVNLPEYVLECVDEKGNEVTFEVDVNFDCFEEEGVEYCHIHLLGMVASRGKFPEGYKPYYHEV